jgi:hypothetical protein
MEPITIIVTALVAGAAAGLKPTAEQAVKDAYGALKNLIRHKYGQAAASVEHLEAAPDSKARRAVVEEDLGKANAGQDAELLKQAQAILEAVQAHDPDAARVVGISLEEIKGASLELNHVLAQGTSSATGVIIKKAEVTGDIKIFDVTAVGGLDAGRPAQSQVRQEPDRIRILFLAANPTDSTRLRLDQEVREIDHVLGLARFRDHFDLEQQWAVRVAELQGLLLRHQPHIVHFSGHGSSLGEIFLEDDAGLSQPVSPRALSTTFGLLKDNMRCVVLNACFSRIQAEAIAQHIECVVGMSQAIGDRAAISFAAAFYQAVASGRDVQSAFELGRAQIDLQNLNEQDTPQLLAPRCDPSKLTFVQVARKQ